MYTWDEIPQEDIDANTQDSDFLLNLSQALYDKIKRDNTVCDKIQYKHYDQSLDIPESFMNEIMKNPGPETDIFLQQIEAQRKERDENPNPWDHSLSQVKYWNT